LELEEINMNKDACTNIIRPHLVPKAERIRVLYIDDEPSNLLSFKANFRQKFEVLTTDNPDCAIDLVEQQHIQVVVSDQRMPGMTGIQFFNQLKNVLPDPTRILLTGYSDLEAVVDAINLGEIYRYVTKPWDYDELLLIIEQAYELFWLKQERQALQDSLITTNDQLEFMVRQKLLS
jgi:response regulator RpfG family c-di-GMP phosphodiesterase